MGYRYYKSIEEQYKPTSKIVMENIRMAKWDHDDLCNKSEDKIPYVLTENSQSDLPRKYNPLSNHPCTNPYVSPIQNSQYTHIQFAELLAKTIHQINDLSKNKGEEYAGHGNDRLANFRQIANDLSLKMEDVWAVYTTKHWRAIMTYITDLKKDEQPTRLEPISGRIDDLIVYCILLKAMVEEREGK